LKGQLSIPPLFHQLDARIKAHVMVAFLGYRTTVTLKHPWKRRPPGARLKSSSSMPPKVRN
jgi:transposase